MRRRSTLEILSGIRVVDLTSVVMGPYCTMILGDLGADVIKVEPPGGDTMRHVGPSRTPGMGSIFLNCNRNKRSVVLDIKHPMGRDALKRMIRQADVFVHSLRPTTMEKLGLTYEALSRENPRLIYCGTYGFRKDGPYGSWPAYDDIIQGISGMAASQREMTGDPRYVAGIYADKTTGLTAVYAILAALFHRERTGEGQEVEVPMFETMVSFHLLEHLYGLIHDPPLGPAYYPRATSRFRKPYRTKDGYLSVLVYKDKHWKAFFEIIGRTDLLEDERFKDLQARTAHIHELYRLVEEVLPTKTSREWMELFHRAEIPAAPYYEVKDLLSDPHLQKIGFFEKADHPTEGTLVQIGFPVRFSATPARTRRPAPRLGEHSIEVLQEYGFDEENIRRLLAEGVTKTP